MEEEKGREEEGGRDERGWRREEGGGKEGVRGGREGGVKRCVSISTGRRR